MSGTTIDVYADIWCPFARVGLRRFMRHRHELGRDDLHLRVRAWPLELVNGRPQDPWSTLEHIRLLRSQVTPELFSGFDPLHFPSSTLEPLALASAAYRRDEETGEEVSLELRDLLFERGVDVSSPSALAELSARHHLEIEPEDRAIVLADWRGGQRRGVRGSPHFFSGTHQVFCPALAMTRGDDALTHLALRDELLTELIEGSLSATTTAR